MSNPTSDIQLYSPENIQSRIYTIRGVQVMLDRDLAFYYGVETKRINEQMKRNQERFPEDFCFQLTNEEAESILMSQNATSNPFSSKSQNATLKDGTSPKSQNATLKVGRGHNLKYLPYAYTEQGVSQLSSVLKSSTAAQMSVRIMRAFVAMRRYISAHAGVLQRLDSFEQFRVEMKQDLADTNTRIDQILDRLDDGTLKVKMGVFFDQQMFDANVLIEQIVSEAKTRIVLIDDYVTSEILQRFHTHAPGVPIDCYVKSRLATDDIRQKFTDFRSQYPDTHCQLHTFERSHDRWLIIDQTVYHFGASIKDLGKRWFSVDICTEYTADELIARLD